MSRPPFDRTLRTAAYAVHLFTATGAILGLLALAAALERRFDLAFLWLGLAGVVDGVDGTFARWLRVTERAQRFDGAVLDLVVDYVTYVLVPAVILLMAGVLPPALALPVVGVLCFTAALYFADTGMKTEEGGFRGFPAVWNVVAFYVLVFTPPPAVTVAAILGLAALQFAPIVFLHPVRVRRMRWLNLALLAVWTVAAGAALLRLADVPLWARVVLAATGLWFMTVGAFSAMRQASSNELDSKLK